MDDFSFRVEISRWPPHPPCTPVPVSACAVSSTPSSPSPREPLELQSLNGIGEGRISKPAPLSEHERTLRTSWRSTCRFILLQLAGGDKDLAHSPHLQSLVWALGQFTMGKMCGIGYGRRWSLADMVHGNIGKGHGWPDGSASPGIPSPHDTRRGVSRSVETL